MNISQPKLRGEKFDDDDYDYDNNKCIINKYIIIIIIITNICQWLLALYIALLFPIYLYIYLFVVIYMELTSLSISPSTALTFHALPNYAHAGLLFGISVAFLLLRRLQTRKVNILEKSTSPAFEIPGQIS